MNVFYLQPGKGLFTLLLCILGNLAIAQTQPGNTEIRLSLTEAKNWMAPHIQYDRLGQFDPQQIDSSWLVRIVQTASDQIYYVDGMGQAILLREGTMVNEQVLQDSLAALRLWLTAEVEAALTLHHIQGDTLFFSNGSFLLLPNHQTPCELPELSLNGTILQLGPNQQVDLQDLIQHACCADDQLLALNGSLLTIEGGNTVDLAGIGLEDPDQDPKNELQKLWLDGQVLHISDGNSVVLPFPSWSESGSKSDSPTLENGCCVPTVYNYQELRNSPPDSEVVFVTAPRIQGLFFQVPEGSEDGGTLIQSISGEDTLFWQRYFPAGQYKLDWWPIGGYTPLDEVDHLIHSASDILNTILTTTNGGVTIDVSSADSPRIIELDKAVRLKKNTTIIGNGDTFKRKDAVWTILSQGAGGNSKNLYVADTSGFHPGQTVLVTNGRHYGQNNGKVLTIKKLEEGLIKTTTKLGTGMSAGDTVVVAFPLFKNGDPLGNIDRIRFSDVNFDGNWAGNPFTVQWNVSNTISFNAAIPTRLVVERARFHSIPGENIIASSCHLVDIDADSLSGSFFHSGGLLDTMLGVVIENVKARQVNLAGDLATGHSEAFIVSSGPSAKIVLHNIHAWDGGEAFFGDVGGSTRFWEMHDCRVENFRYVLLGGVGSSEEHLEHLVATNNVFINANSFQFSGGSFFQERYARHILLENNLFLNTTLHLQDIRESSIINNRFVYDPAQGGINFLGDGTNEAYLEAMVSFQDFVDLEFRGNSLLGPKEPIAGIKHGVVFDNTETYQALQNQWYYLGTGLNCTDNHIRHFLRAISFTYDEDGHPFTTPNLARSYAGFLIAHNQIWMQAPQDEEYGWGITAGPGVEVNGNLIYAPTSKGPGTAIPIMGYGAHPMVADRILGAKVLHNQISGPVNPDPQVQTFSILAGGAMEGNENAAGAFNCIVHYNNVHVPIHGNGTEIGGMEPGEPNGSIKNNFIQQESLPWLNLAEPPNGE